MQSLNSLQYLVFTIINVYSLVLMLRLWLQFSKADFYNPISQAVVKITNPVLNPLRKIFKPIRNVDTAAIFCTFILGVVKLPLLMLFGGVWTSEIITSSLPELLLIGVLSVIANLGQMLLYVIFIGAILSWFQRGNNPLAYFLYQLGEPALAPIRRILPKTGMIDFSPMILAFVLFWLNRVMYDLIPVLWSWA